MSLCVVTVIETSSRVPEARLNPTAECLRVLLTNVLRREGSYVGLVLAHDSVSLCHKPMNSEKLDIGTDINNIKRNHIHNIRRGASEAALCVGAGFFCLKAYD